MKALGDIVRENIKGLQAYSCARAEFEGTDVTLLDANENPFASEYNRYPDPFQRELKREIGRLKGVDFPAVQTDTGSNSVIVLNTQHHFVKQADLVRLRPPLGWFCDALCLLHELAFFQL